LGCLGTATMREIEDGQLVTERNIWIADHGHLGFGRVGGGNGGSGLSTRHRRQLASRRTRHCRQLAPERGMGNVSGFRPIQVC
jgi:hypothetical protein